MNQSPIDLRTKLTRRRLLAGFSGLTVALTSPVWRTATVFGADAKLPPNRRFFGMFSADGTSSARFWPTGIGFDSPLVLSKCLAGLERHKQIVNVLKGVHFHSTIENELGKGTTNERTDLKPGGPHMKGGGALFTGGSLGVGDFTGSGGPAGYADRQSVDQFLAGTIGKDNTFPSLEFGVRIDGQEPLRYISYRGAKQPNTAIDDPVKMYGRMVTKIMAPGAAPVPDNSEAIRLLAEHRSVLDFVAGDLQRLSQRVTAEDRARLEAHTEQIRMLEKQLGGVGTGGTGVPLASCAKPSMPAKLDPKDRANYATIGRMQTDLMVLAHVCNLTRVSTFMWANANSWQTYPWLGINDEHHELSHSADSDVVANDKLEKIYAWHSEQMAYLLDKLAAAVEPDGSTMLDNSLVLWGNELGAGNRHDWRDIPWVMMGKAGGAIKSGRFLQYGDMPHNNLLVSVCQAMGLSDVTTFGIPGVCTGPLAGLGG